MTTQQQEFLIDEIWLLSFNGAFSRNTIYKPNVTDNQKQEFKKALRTYIEKVIHPGYKTVVDDALHRSFMIAIMEASKDFSTILKYGQLNVGTVQKLLNLSLKYYWCLGLLEKPPHFPIDRIIQKKLPWSQRVNWTDINTLEQYDTLIENFRALCPKGKSLAEWELENFNRRANA